MEVIKILESVSAKLQSTQAGRNILRRLQSGAITEVQAIKAMQSLPKSEAIVSDLQALKEFLVTNPVTGVLQMNPLLEAAIAERAFLDGDVPELRIGPIPVGGKPAVPVQTMSTNPIVVGYMLEQASSIIDNRFDQALIQFQEDRQKYLEDFHKSGEALGVDVSSLAPLAEKSLAFPALPTGVEGYRAGRKPERMVVAEPASLSNIPVELKRQYAYKALTTTQGKESLTPGITKGILTALQLQGVVVSEGVAETTEHTASWGMNIFGAEDLSHHFNFAELAVKTISQELLTKPLTTDSWLLCVEPLNGVSQRYFGWQASLGRRHA